MKTKSISMSNGKGDKPRPVEIDKETFDKNWQKTFKKKKKPVKPKKDEETNE
jgi:hypothetical protein